jgi:four helix bundle protein
MRDGIELLEKRTKGFAVSAIRLCVALEQEPGIRHLADQLVRSAGSVAANHRAMRRSRSDREFAAKLQIVNEEIDEAVLWLEIADEICADLRGQIRPLLSEGIELRSIFARARATTRRRFN